MGYDGQLIDSYRKMYLPNYGVFDEDRYFRRGDVCPVYTINGTGVGVSICEDIWYPLGPIAVQREAGAEVIVNINGSPFHAGKQTYREKMIATRAADNELIVAYLNLVGGQDELIFDGSSLVCERDGRYNRPGARPSRKPWWWPTWTSSQCSAPGCETPGPARKPHYSAGNRPPQAGPGLRL